MMHAMCATSSTFAYTWSGRQTGSHRTYIFDKPKAGLSDTHIGTMSLGNIPIDPGQVMWSLAIAKRCTFQWWAAIWATSEQCQQE
ncbi:hypothetical protein PAXRUDRAFT_343361 [Paxillus rubicundulus Ve08.2h10]|uniref:Uncharacterized protein n=1 Tax=Paxillus rubicundulus Ve08.2h10 TaxID=930991 RepID=A0A0D0DS11_9AGAM|nr:hypothetical protein PAXRUDRAFT_343361 [Paxillus rubicundulus Ve08.2h10]